MTEMDLERVRDVANYLRLYSDSINERRAEQLAEKLEAALAACTPAKSEGR